MKEDRGWACRMSGSHRHRSTLILKQLLQLGNLRRVSVGSEYEVMSQTLARSFSSSCSRRAFSACTSSKAASASSLARVSASLGHVEIRWKHYSTAPRSHTGINSIELWWKKAMNNASESNAPLLLERSKLELLSLDIASRHPLCLRRGLEASVHFLQLGDFQGE